MASARHGGGRVRDLEKAEERREKKRRDGEREGMERC
jgi:hypothetical protein